MFSGLNTISPESELGKTARKLSERFNRRKQSVVIIRRELTNTDYLKLDEVTIRETPREEVEKRMERILQRVEKV